MNIAIYQYIVIGASLSEPHHVRSTVKSVFLLALLYMAQVQVHVVLATLHQTQGVLTIVCTIKC